MCNSFKILLDIKSNSGAYFLLISFITSCLMSLLVNIQLGRSSWNDTKQLLHFFLQWIHLVEFQYTQIRRIDILLDNQEIAHSLISKEPLTESISRLWLYLFSNRKDTIYKWIQNMQSRRRVYSPLFGDTLQVSAAKDCLQARVLSSLLWDLVIDKLLVKLKIANLYTKLYAGERRNHSVLCLYNRH